MLNEMVEDDSGELKKQLYKERSLAGGKGWLLFQVCLVTFKVLICWCHMVGGKSLALHMDLMLSLSISFFFFPHCSAIKKEFGG